MRRPAPRSRSATLAAAGLAILLGGNKRLRRPPNLPFLNGPPSFSVGLHPLGVEQWLAPDWERDWIESKRRLLDHSRPDVVATEDGSRDAQAEAATLIGAAVRGLGDFGQGGFGSGAFGSGQAKLADLAQAARLVSDDLVVLQRSGPHPGAWRVTAAVLCAPTFFSCHEAIGKSLHGLHGPVPDRLANGAQGLGDRIGRVFDHLREDLILERFNWTVQPGPDRFTPSAPPLWARVPAITPQQALDVLHLRVERQTIRRLPRTGAVLFTIRVSLDSLRAVFREAGAMMAFETAWREAPDEVRRYKRWPPLEHLVRGALDSARAQATA